MLAGRYRGGPERAAGGGRLACTPHPLINLVLWPKTVSLEYNSAVGLGGGSYYSQGTPCATGPRLAGSCKLYSRGLGVGGAAVAPPPLTGSVSGSKGPDPPLGAEVALQSPCLRIREERGTRARIPR